MRSRPSWRRSKTLTANRYRPPHPHPEYRPRDARGDSPWGPPGQPLPMALIRAGLPILSRAAFVTRSTSSSWPNSRA